RAGRRVEERERGFGIEGVGRDAVDDLLGLEVFEARPEDPLGRPGDQSGDKRADDRPEQREEEPYAERGERGGRRGAEDDREKQRHREPDAAVSNRRDEKAEHAQRLLGARRQTEKEEAEPQHEEPQRDKTDRQREETGEKFPQQ